MNLCIFLPTGKTFTFRDVEYMRNDESVLHFLYTAMSDGQRKEAVFPKAGIAGWSAWVEES